jgi:hypothetical protein
MTAISCFRYATAGDGDRGQTGQFICFKTGQLYLLTTRRENSLRISALLFIMEGYV